MRYTETAKKNREELFPRRESAMAVMDPELAEVFENFAFGEVPASGSLDSRTRCMVILAGLVAGGSLGEYKTMLAGALNAGVTPVEAKEVLYHAVPYVGMGRVLDFLEAANEILVNRRVKLPLAGQSTTSPETRFEKGLALQKAIFGEAIGKRQQEGPADEAHIQRFLAANCFGDIWTRTGIEVRVRELLTFSMLLALGGCEPQLKGHIQGNANVGNGRQVLLDAATQLIPYVGYPRVLNAVRCIDEVLPE